MRPLSLCLGWLTWHHPREPAKQERHFRDCSVLHHCCWTDLSSHSYLHTPHTHESTAGARWPASYSQPERLRFQSCWACGLVWLYRHSIFMFCFGNFRDQEWSREIFDHARALRFVPVLRMPLCLLPIAFVSIAYRRKIPALSLVEHSNSRPHTAVCWSLTHACWHSPWML